MRILNRTQTLQTHLMTFPDCHHSVLQTTLYWNMVYFRFWKKLSSLNGFILPEWSQQQCGKKNKIVFKKSQVWISPLVWHLFQGFCVIPPPRTVWCRKKNIPAPHWSWFQLNWSWEWGWGDGTPGLWVMEGNGVRPIKNSLFNTARGWNRGTEEWTRHFSSFPALHLLAPGPQEIIQSGSILLGRAEDKVQAVPPRRCEGRANFTGPLGQKLHLSYMRVTTGAKV